MMATTGMSMKTRTALLVSTAVLLTSLILLNCAPCVAAVQPFPVELDGFVGQLMGTVVVAPNPGGLSIKVTKVTPASESKIKSPMAAPSLATNESAVRFRCKEINGS